tara:strand:+ start:631 stop:1023 length:393 start_codon:yes stop_codon:yes gene_type:complete
MKHNSEEILTQVFVHSSGELNTDDFLKRLHRKIEEKKQNLKTINLSVLMLVALVFLSYTKLGISQTPEMALYYLDESDNLFKTDFWDIDVDLYYFDLDYSNVLTYFLLKEGDLWETVELFNEILLIEEES